MKFSSLIFPFPSPPTYTYDRLVGELLYIPKDFTDCPYKYSDSSKADSKIYVQSMSGQSFISKPGKILEEIDFNQKSESLRGTIHSSTPNYST